MKVLKDVKFWVGIVISGVLLYFLFSKDIDWHEAALAVRKTSIPLVVISLGSVIFSMYLRAIRWRYLLYDVKKITIGSLFSSVMIGFMANNLCKHRLFWTEIAIPSVHEGHFRGVDSNSVIRMKGPGPLVSGVRRSQCNTTPLVIKSSC